MFQLDISIVVILSVLGAAGLKSFMGGARVTTKKAGVISETVLQPP